MHQSHHKRLELIRMPRDRLSDRRRTTPAVQVHNLIQQKIRRSPRSRSSQRWSYCKRLQERARSKNQVMHRDQTTLAGENLTAKDNNSFRHEFPEQPTLNSSIITFQNTGQMKQFIMSEKSEHIVTVFKKSNASVALYAENLLHQILKDIPGTEQFHQQMINVNPSFLSKNCF